MIAFNPLAGELQEKGSSNLIKFDPLSGKFVYAVGDNDPIADIPGLVLRWQSWSPETFLDAGGNPVEEFEEVETILDLSIAGNDATQASVTKQGLWFTNQINGHGALNMDPVDDGYTSPCDLTSDYTIFLVSNTGAGGGIRTVNGSPGNRLISTSRNNAAVFAGSAIVSDLSAFADTWTIGCLRISQTLTSSNFRLNGVDITENATVAAAWGLVLLGHVGVIPEPVNGSVAFVAAFDRTLDLSEVQTVEQYLSEKTAIPIP